MEYSARAILDKWSDMWDNQELCLLPEIYTKGVKIMGKHRQGGKFGGSHTSLIDHAVDVVDAAAKLEFVSRIVLGVIDHGKSKKPRLKFKPIQAGLEVVVYGPITLQTVYVYTTDPKAAEKAMAQAFER